MNDLDNLENERLESGMPRRRTAPTAWRRIKTALLCLLLLFAVSPVFTLGSDILNLEVINHKGGLFVLINQEYYGQSGPQVLMFLRAAAGVAREQDLREDLIVYHLSQGHLERYLYKGLSPGTPGAYQGRLNYSGSTQRIRSDLWQWTGHGLVPLTQKESSPIFSVIEPDPTNGLNPSDGWQVITDVRLSSTNPYTRTEKRTSIKVGAQEYTVIFRRTPFGQNPPGESYSLQGPGLARPEQLLYAWKQNEKMVSWRTYKRATDN